ncbi:MAG: hypothetical protein HN348_06475 [Proteobacteria bacterium]|nr:hypothetical protein [Pseudomonadota bacterium]
MRTYSTRGSGGADSSPKTEEQKAENLEEMLGNEAMQGLLEEEGSTQDGFWDDITTWFHNLFSDDEETVAVEEAETVKADEVAEVVEEVVADPTLAARTDTIVVGATGAIIGAAENYKVWDGPGADASSSDTIVDGKPVEVVEVSDARIKIKYRDGNVNAEGWVDKAYFSPQPDLNRETSETGEEVQEDYLYKLVEGDQTPTATLSGSDVAQGYLADCFFIAALNAVGNARPEHLQDAITYDASTGLYKVRFYEETGWDWGNDKPIFTEHYEYVDGYLPQDSGNLAYADATSASHWGPIYEKAFAQWRGGYDEIGEGGASSDAMEALTGVQSVPKTVSTMAEDEVVPFFEQAKTDGLAVTCGSLDSMEGTKQTPLTSTAQTTYKTEEGPDGTEIKTRVPHPGPYKGKITLGHADQTPKPGTVKITDSDGHVAQTTDSGAGIHDEEAELKGTDLKSGEVQYETKDLELLYKDDKGPDKDSDLEVEYKYWGLIFPAKTVYAWHAYVFDSVVDGKIKLYNPWGSCQPDPLTAAEFQTYFSDLSTNKVPQKEKPEAGA